MSRPFQGRDFCVYGGNMIKIENVYKTFSLKNNENLHALKGVTFEVGKNSILVLLV